MKNPKRRYSVLLLSAVLSVGLAGCGEGEEEGQVFEEEDLGMQEEEDLQDEYGTDSEFEDEEPLENFYSEPLGEEELEEGFEDDQALDEFPVEDEEPLEADEVE